MSVVKLARRDLDTAVVAQVIAPAQADALWLYLTNHSAAVAPPVRRFDLSHLFWYTGALIVIAALGIFQTSAWAAFGPLALVVIALLYAGAAIIVGDRLWRQPDLRTPGGLLIVIAVTMAPLAVYGLLAQLDWWALEEDPGSYRDFYHWIRGSWLPMSLATIAAAGLALRFWRFPFLTAPIAVALWFISMDLVPWLFGPDWYDWNQRAIVGLVFGLAMLLVAWTVDLRAHRDFAFWLHLFAALTLWGGVTGLYAGDAVDISTVLALSLLLLLLGVYLGRSAYTVFGAFGVFHFIGWLTFVVFADSILFPFALTGLGVAIMAAGVVLLRYSPLIESWVDAHLPRAVRGLRPR